MSMRILSLSPSSTEILYALGAQDDIIGVTQHCDFPNEARWKPQFGTWLHTHPERVVAAEPDLIVTTTYFPKELENICTTHSVLHLQPRSLASVYESILQLGSATGRTQPATHLVQDMQRSFEQLRANAPAHKLRVYSEEWQDPPMISGNWVPEIIELIGGEPIGGVHHAPSSPVYVDALRYADPDIMFFQWCTTEKPDELQSIRTRPGWENFRAVQTNALVRVPSSLLNRPGPRLVDGAQRMQHALHQYQHLH